MSLTSNTRHLRHKLPGYLDPIRFPCLSLLGISYEPETCLRHQCSS